MTIRAVLSLVAVTLFTASTAAQAHNRFNGRAIAVKTTVAGLSVVASDTKELPQTGGFIEKKLDLLEVPGLISAELLHSTTAGGGNDAKSFAELANAGLTVAGVINLSASVVNANSIAHCNGLTPSVGGDSEIVGLKVNGAPITVTGAPNQTLVYKNLPGLLTASVIINQQTKTWPASNRGGITVNAIRIIVKGPLGLVADVTVGSARSGITCVL